MNILGGRILKRKICRVLVTGAGSGVGQGIIKALRISGLPVTIVAADISPMNAGLYRADEAVIFPPVESEGALNKILECLALKKIDVVMIGSEFDLEFFSDNRETIESSIQIKVIVAPPETVRIANDKWLTVEFLKENGLSYPESAISSDVSEAISITNRWGYPVVLKTRYGTSSRSVHIIENDFEMETFYPLVQAPMLQRVIEMPTPTLQREYTCSVFKAATGETLRPFMARRTLRGGTSWHIEVSDFPALTQPLLAIAEKLRYFGPLNIQLMLTEKGPVPFEFNARFSGTTAVRAHFGFNEPALILQNVYYHEPLLEPEIRSGIAMRYHEEVFIDDVTAISVEAGIHKGLVRPWF